MKIIYLICLIIAGVLVTNCGTTIPARDTVEPTFIFHIQGDGLNDDINENFDFDNKVLYLRRNARYRVVYSIVDSGGLKEMYWELPSSRVIALSERAGSGIWTIQNSGSPFRDRYKWTGDSLNPVRNGIVSYRRVDAIGGPLDGTVPNYEMDFTITDLLGNTTNKTLIVRITGEQSRIGTRD